MEKLAGFRDFYPEPLPFPDAWSHDLRHRIFEAWRSTSRRYGFREYDGPPLEPLELFTMKSGTEIVGQLYCFTDKGDRQVSLRPEMTPTLARMVAAAERHYKKPIKWFAIPQLFRYERQQKGRLKEHFQFNADVFGENDRAADAELIALLIDSLRALGLTKADFVVRLSSRNAWQDFFASHGGKPEDAYQFFQIVDKLERETEDASQLALSKLGFSLDQVRGFITSAAPTVELAAILGNLASRGLSEFVKLDYGVIRGLAYYTGPVFEAFDRQGKFRAIAGGGRYDSLVKLISGGKVDLPGLGFGMGDVVLGELLKDRGLAACTGSGTDVYVVVEDETLRGESLQLIQMLRDAGLAAEYSLTPLKGDKQFKRAMELQAGHTVRVERGSTEAGGSLLQARVRHLKSREERVLGFEGAVAHLRGLKG